LTATATDSSGNSVGVSTEVVGTVNSVDLTQSPPLLNINGQTFTVNQIESISTEWSGAGPRKINHSFTVRRTLASFGRRDCGVGGIFKANLIEALGLGKF
jgi:hypothetical protein